MPCREASLSGHALMPIFRVEATSGVEEIMTKTNVNCQSSLGMLWFAGWLFSLGYLNLGFWKGLFGLLVWPYFLGAALGAG